MSYEARCTICKEPVNLEESKTDEYGQAIHENCYVWTVELKKQRKAMTSLSIHDYRLRPQAL